MEYEITIVDDIGWVFLEHHDEENRLNGAVVIRIPIKITNLSEETRGFSTYPMTIYGPYASRLEDISSYFMGRSDVRYLNNMQSGETVSDRYIHILYIGDGDYSIVFDTWTEANREVIVHILKED